MLKTFSSLACAGSCVLVLVVSASSGCANVLGVEDIKVSLQGEGGILTTSDDGGIVEGIYVECISDSQCAPKLPVVSPIGCAVAKCQKNVCVYVALDNDGDGLTVKCASSDPAKSIKQSANVDCDDSKAGIVTGSEVDCTDGSFALPGKGICRPGKQNCKPDGTFTQCSLAAGTKPKAEDCSNLLDDDCDGAVNNGCGCSPGTAPIACGPAAVGVCKPGTQACVGGMWAACLGAVVAAAAPNCLSSLDNNCNGVPDKEEAACKCDGTAIAGATKSCSTGLSGVCAPGVQTCNVSATAALWGGCVGNVNPATATRVCAGSADSDCNGYADNAEAPCKCGGTFAIGASQKCGAANCNFRRACEDYGSTAVWGACGDGLLLPVEPCAIP
jgi:hypothetical protein